MTQVRGRKTSGVIGRFSATFRCKVCGRDAETVHFLEKGAPGNPCSYDAINYDFESETLELQPDTAPAVKRAVIASDAAALHAAHPRYLATYCPECRGCYCKKHWRTESWPDPQSDSWSMYYDTFGTCPAGHKRLMAKDSLSWPDEEPEKPLIIRP
jgi:hypothetical protein